MQDAQIPKSEHANFRGEGERKSMRIRGKVTMQRFLLVLTVIAATAPLFAQQLSDQQVQQAIASGNGKHRQIGLTLIDQQTAFLSGMACATCGQSGYKIVVYNPAQWIEHSADQAKSEMQPFSITDVTAEMREPNLHVIALPSRAEYLTGAGISGSSSVHRIVLSDTARQTTIQPTDVKMATVQGNSALRSVDYTMASAYFPMSAVASLQANDSKGEFFIVVVGDNQNKFFKVKSRDMKTLFPEGRPVVGSTVQAQQSPAQVAPVEATAPVAVPPTVIPPAATPVTPAPPVIVPASTPAPNVGETPQAEQVRAERNTVVTSSGGSESLADAAKRNKQRKACLVLAADNPSIVCK
jgi:hypothetical protein